VGWKRERGLCAEQADDGFAIHFAGSEESFGDVVRLARKLLGNDAEAEGGTGLLVADHTKICKTFGGEGAQVAHGSGDGLRRGDEADEVLAVGGQRGGFDHLPEAKETRDDARADDFGAVARPLGPDRFELHTGGFRAVIHAVSSNFGTHTVTWEINQAEGRACVDGICYRGTRKRFNFAELESITIVAGLELLPVGKAPVNVAPKMSTIQANWAQATWSLGHGGRSGVPPERVPTSPAGSV